MPVPLRLLGRARTQIAAAYQARCLANNSDIELPPEPTTCCMSGCANCVWVEYAKTVAKILGDNDDRARELVLAKIKDPNLRVFLEMELRNLKQLRESRPEEPKK
ncbi:oxidoreductase-like domain-containing protein 1 [Drosophila hydei]|uniref:Oxidoreductase-like domain-containing protein 1 n=1 Tax=Drosophila hydei TaxID=7224 RepID=A0A6J1M797_DROHY|nr:oxidoreductase-like domain-containing protein 1 [Drosophila hydei]